jgi:hypothetical protein
MVARNERSSRMTSWQNAGIRTGLFDFSSKSLILYLLSRNRMVDKANLPLQGNEFKEQRALASNGHVTRMVGFEPGALRIFRVE